MTTKTEKTQRLILKLVCALCVLAPVLAANYAECNAQDRPSRTRQLEPPGRPSHEPVVAAPLVEPGEDYLIGPGDVIEIQVDRAPELSRTYRVNANGTILMQYLGRISVQRKTPEGLGSFIADGLRGRYLKNPHVAVDVKQINSHAFFIQGAVNRPGVYQVEGRPSLLKLITVAGGLADDHGSVAFIIREAKREAKRPAGTRNGERETAGSPEVGVTAAASKSQSLSDGRDVDEGEGYELLRLNINGLFKGKFDQNMYIEPGSIVNIPPTDVFFVAGEVQAPGSYPLKDGTTLRQAISLAQGTTFKAASSRGVVFRDDPATGKRQEIKVDISAVMSGRNEDLRIMANDIVIVPNSRFKSVGGALLTALGVNATRFPRY